MGHTTTRRDPDPTADRLAPAAAPPAPVAQMSPPAFVGRARQQAELTEALSGPPTVVLVEGEAGIGKSRLVHEFLVQRGFLAPPGDGPRGDGLRGDGSRADSSRADGSRGDGPARTRALVGVCPPYREPSTLAPVVDALRQAGDQLPRLRLSGLAGALRPLFPEWADDLPPAPDRLDDPKAARHRLFRALAELIGCLGADVLALEDVHWADEVSLELMLFLATRPAGPPVSIVLTYRPEDVPADSLLLRLSARLPAGVPQVRLTLPALDVSATAALVSSMLGGATVSGTFAAFLRERTDGLPLAVEESVRLLGERADLVNHRGEWVRRSLAGLEVPPTVRDSTRERLQRLPPAAQQVLRAAAVLAVPEDEATIVAVAGGHPDTAPAGVAQAVASRLLAESPVGRLAFRHVLPAAATYEAIPGPARRELHQRAGEVLAARRPPPAALLARHFREAGDLAGWARWAELAADTACESSDYLAAVMLLDGLADAPGLPLATRARLARKLAHASLYVQAVNEERSHRIVRSLRTVVDAPGLSVRHRAELRNLLGRLLGQQGDHASGFVEMARAVRHLDHEPVHAARTMISLGWPQGGPWPASVHLRWLHRAEALTASLVHASPADRLGLLVDRAAALLQLGAEEGWRLAETLPADATSPEERLHLARGHLNVGDIAMYWGRYGQARELLTEAYHRSERHEFARVREIALATLLRLDWLTGRWQGLAQRLAELTDGYAVESAARQEARLVAGLHRVATGGPAAAETELKEVLEFAHPRGAPHLAVGAALGLARRWLVEGKVAEAQQVTEEPTWMVTHKKVWLWAADLVPVRVAALLATGAREPAARLVTDLAGALGGADAPAPAAALELARALLAAHDRRYPEAGAGFARAARAYQDLPRPYDALLAREQLARTLLAVGQTEAGAGLLAEVFDGLRELGADGDASRLAGTLRQLGKDVVRPWRGGRRGYGDQLSPREREVVRLVVAGKTNREIAQELSKAPGTVAEQLRSAMRKLGVSSRTAVAVSALAAGVVDDQPAVPRPRRRVDVPS